MAEQFDEDLKHRIQQVFEGFEDPSADEGWLLLREKFPEKKKDSGVVWLWFASAAAILLLVLGIGTWVNLKKEQPDKLSYKPIKIIPQKNHIAVPSSLLAKKQGDLVNAGSNKTIQKVVIVNSSTQTVAIIKNKKPYYFKTGRNYNSNPGGIKGDSAGIKGHTVNDDKTAIASNITDMPVTGNEKQSAAAFTVKDTIAKNNAIASIIKPVQKPKRSLFDDDKKDNFKINQVTQKGIPGKTVQFSVYAATYFNYAKGSSNQVNVGAGITSDIRLSKNLKLSTGVAIAQNSLSYATQQAVSNFAQPSVSNFAKPVIANTSFNSIPVTSFKNYDAQLVGLDIPVNLKYEFNPEKNDSYFSLGLSSGTFINESYTSQYGLNPNNITQSQTTSSSFSNFYFAKTLNVSFGIGYPINKTNRLTIEPFLKYPLDGMGSQQIKFGAGGVNLKFDFQPSKK